MEQKVEFRYFYGNEADQYTFYRIPKLLFTHPYFRELSCDAKVLYGIMLDRVALSVKNNWFDTENRAYIYFSVEDTMELLNCGKNKAIKTIKELEAEEGIGLIEKKRQGFGKTSIIYVKSFNIAGEVYKEDLLEEKSEENDEEKMEVKFENQTCGENMGQQEVYNLNHEKFTNQTSRSLKNKPREVYISNPNNTKTNNTELNHTKSNHTESSSTPVVAGKQISEHQTAPQPRAKTKQDAYEEYVKENMEYDLLMEAHPEQTQLIQELFEIIFKTIMSNEPWFRFAGVSYTANGVKGKFMKLKRPQIEYVLESINKNKNEIRNREKYLQAVLFNAPLSADNNKTA